MTKRSRTILTTAVLAGLIAWWPAPAAAQYFGQNKVAYERLDFRVLRTANFDIYFYPEEEAAVAIAARMAERWRERIGSLLGFQLMGRQPLVLFAAHPHFEQTNVIEGLVDPGTGGVTEGLKRRIALPFAASLGDTDHVLGHEIVHAFQYQALADAGGPPLWFIEGMAEYVSIGPADVHTAMWLRDAALHGRFPEISDLDDPRYFPYRFGHAFWAYVGGRFGDAAIGRILRELGGPTDGPRMDAIRVIEAVTGRDRKTLSAEWRQAVLAEYALPDLKPERDNPKPPPGVVIGTRTSGGRINIGPSLSPDGRRVAFLSERGRLSIEAYVADAGTGRVIATLTETAADPHFQSLQFLASAGAWHPNGQQLALAAVRSGRPVLAIVDADNGHREREIRFPDIGEIFQPAWSPDGRFIAFAGQAGGVSDLFVHDLGTGQTRRLTSDPFADLQPVWSPDSKRLAFVTDRFTSNLETLAFGDYRLATIDVTGGAPQPVATGHDGDQMNPSWSADGLYFLSNVNGTQDIYRLADGDRVERVTHVGTGVTGITALSPAMSASPAGDRLAFSVFRDTGYEIHVTRAGQPLQIAGAGQVRITPELPPRDRRASAVSDFLRQPRAGLPAQGTGEVRGYDSSLQLLDVGQALGLGVSRSFGAQAVGGLSMSFSDMLGNHLVGTDLILNGGARDVGGQAFYLNRSRRWYWGLLGEHVPMASGFVRQSLAEIDGEPAVVEDVEMFRQTNTQTGALTAYPFSRATRLEFSGSARRIGFTREVQRRAFSLDTGVLLADEKFDLAAPASLALFDVSSALVRDTAAFGATGPVVGQRARLEITPTFGDLRYTGVSLDVRQYFMPAAPVTIAIRGLHVGRYGASAESELMAPLFIGYSQLVRGYDVGTFDGSECTPTADGSCPEFDRLVGSRMFVTNLEVRAPLVGLFRGRLDYGYLPVDIFAFADAGMAWTRDTRPATFGGTREWVTSVGAGLRANAFGFLIAELNMVRPLNRPRGWIFVFNLRPGF